VNETPLYCWFNIIDEQFELALDTLQELLDSGFVVIPGPIPPDLWPQFTADYDAAVSSTAPNDISIGRSTTRVSNFVSKGQEFAKVFLYEPILAACCRVIEQPFKLSTLHSRTVHAHSPAQDLHVDFGRDVQGWPMVGFILMVDEFREDNGATRFVPGSHRWTTPPTDLNPNRASQVVACAPAGSLIIYNGSVWHGHAANLLDQPRRSLQGAFIRRSADAAIDWATRTTPETLDRIGPLGKHLLAI
jgi:ectoine hydroxylase-related dioxygenase (phytanoyl-CoA dioxygenase family)